MDLTEKLLNRFWLEKNFRFFFFFGGCKKKPTRRRLSFKPNIRKLNRKHEMMISHRCKRKRMRRAAEISRMPILGRQILLQTRHMSHGPETGSWLTFRKCLSPSILLTFRPHFCDHITWFHKQMTWNKFFHRLTFISSCSQLNYR